MIFSQVVFSILIVLVFGVAFIRYRVIVQNIRLGKAELITGNIASRLKNVLLIAFGQKKMFTRPIPGIFHFFIYTAFLLTQIELIEIIIDGICGTHRFFIGQLGAFYTFLINFIELLSLLAFVATVIFILRRNVLKVKRFRNPEMKGWPTIDANLILIGEIFLLLGIFSMNAADGLLQVLVPDQFPDTGTLFLSSTMVAPILSGLDQNALLIIERAGWWLHILVVFGFILYLPYSKHLHIFFAFPNVYFSRMRARGEMENMPEIMNEVKSMMGIQLESENTSVEIPEFGSKDIRDLSWKTLLEAYSCTECGRCTSVCPANITGKKLSPRKIMMDIRDRTEEFGKNLRSGNAAFFKKATTDVGNREISSFDDGKSLFDYISSEEIYACTTCNACVEACPILINPLEPILAMRRYDILTAAAGPGDWLPMFNSIENTGSVWQMNESRDAWIHN